jgi:hypothetical protein
MPRGDGTGPRGMGRMSGRGAGYCSGNVMPGFSNPLPGRGFGRGSGRGWRNCFYATGLPGWMLFGGYGYGGYQSPAMRPEPELEKQALKAQADALEAELEMIKQRLSAVEETE